MSTYKPGGEEKDDLEVDGGTLSVDADNDKVGIGTDSPKTKLTVEGTVTIKEQANAEADTAAYGQIWVKTATPNQLYFTTDAGNDIQITSGTSLAGGGGGGGGAVSAVANGSDNRIATFSSSDALNGEANLTFDGTDLTATCDSATFTSANANDPLVTIKNTTNDADGARLRFVKDKGAAGAANDVAGLIEFYADDANQDQVLFSEIKSQVKVHTNGQEGGKLTVSVAEHDGTSTAGLVIEDGDADGELDVTLGAGAASVVSVPGVLSVANDIILDDGGSIKEAGGTAALTINASGEITAFKIPADDVAQASDHIIFLDGGASGAPKAESIGDFLTAIAGSGISVSSNQLTAGAGAGDVSMSSNTTTDNVIVTTDGTGGKNVQQANAAISDGNQGLNVGGQLTLTAGTLTNDGRIYSEAKGLVISGSSGTNQDVSLAFSGSLIGFDGDIFVLSDHSINIGTMPGSPKISKEASGPFVISGSAGTQQTISLALSGSNIGMDGDVFLLPPHSIRLGTDATAPKISKEASGPFIISGSAATSETESLALSGSTIGIDGDILIEMVSENGATHKIEFDHRETGPKIYNEFSSGLVISGSAGGGQTSALALSGSIIGFDSDMVHIMSDTIMIESENANDPILTVKNSTNDADGPRIRLQKDKGAAGAANDVAGVIEFYADDANQDNISFAEIKGQVAVHTNGQEGGKLTVSVASHDGEMQPGLIISDGSAEDEIDITIGNGGESVTKFAGGIAFGGVENPSANASGVALSPVGISMLTSGNAGGDDTFTLADGSFIGQIKEVAFVQDQGDDCVVTVASPSWTGGSSGTMTFDTAGDYIKLIWVNPGAGNVWVPLVNINTALA